MIVRPLVVLVLQILEVLLTTTPSSPPWEGEQSTTVACDRRLLSHFCIKFNARSVKSYVSLHTEMIQIISIDLKAVGGVIG